MTVLRILLESAVLGALFLAPALAFAATGSPLVAMACVITSAALFYGVLSQ